MVEVLNRDNITRAELLRKRRGLYEVESPSAFVHGQLSFDLASAEKMDA